MQRADLRRFSLPAPYLLTAPKRYATGRPQTIFSAGAVPADSAETLKQPLAVPLA
ncbi:MAG: hypothetical protein LBO67_05730 [Spirochaetaceae bacterium]|nr:hypothetical protein [Spirochaetaceae bacterium]